MDVMTKYYKVTNVKEYHHNYQYSDGLNILLEPFNDDPKASCVQGGFYFTILEYIPLFYDYGSNLREIILPIDDPDFKMIKDPGPDGNKWRANRIILGEKYSLYDPKTYEKFKLNILDNDYLLDNASSEGRIDVLNWWINSGLNLFYSFRGFDTAAKNGHVDVLDWWDKHITINYFTYVMDIASENGCVNVLEWCKNSMTQIYTIDAIDKASANGHIDVLDWWKNSGLGLKYTPYAIDVASANGHIDVLDWWKNSKLELKYTDVAMDITLAQLRH